MKTYSYLMGLTKARRSLFLHLRLLRHGKTDTGNSRRYGKVHMLEGGKGHEDAKETGVLSDYQLPGQLCSNRLFPK